MSLSVCFYFVHIVLTSNCSDIQLFLILVMMIVVLDLCIGNSVLFFFMFVDPCIIVQFLQ